MNDPTAYNLLTWARDKTLASLAVKSHITTLDGLRETLKSFMPSDVVAEDWLKTYAWFVREYWEVRQTMPRLWINLLRLFRVLRGVWVPDEAKYVRFLDNALKIEIGSVVIVVTESAITLAVFSFNGPEEFVVPGEGNVSSC